MCLRIKCEFIAVYAKSTCLVNGNGTAHRGMMIFCVRDMTNLLLSHIISSLCHISIQSLSVYSPDVWKIKVPLLIFLIACTKKVQNFFLLQVSFIVTLTADVGMCLLSLRSLILTYATSPIIIAIPIIFFLYKFTTIMTTMMMMMTTLKIMKN